MLEVVFENEESAYAIRKAFVAGRKSGKNLGRLNIVNWVTLATSLDVMH